MKLSSVKDINGRKLHFTSCAFFFHSPDPATPTVAAPAPMNLAAESISRVAGEVWNDRTGKIATGVWQTANV